MSIARDPGIGRAAGIDHGDIDDVARERLADVRLAGGEDELDRSLRPRGLADFVNQEQVTTQLGVFIEAARRRGEPLDHVLLAGPPGLGKTSLANIVAAELEVPLVQTAGPALERKADVAAFLTGWTSFVAGFAGSFVPVLLERLGIDPAVASSVFVTTLTDVCGFGLLLGLASLVLL